MKELKYFNQLSEYNSNKDNFTYPTVSYVEENTKVYYKEKPAPSIVTYTTTGTSQQVKLVNKREYLDYAKIVNTGEELTVTGSGALNYTFTDPGEHQVELKFKDDATTLASGFSGCSQLTNIPENLFQYNTAVTDFSCTFTGCKGLTGSIPDNLFSSNTNVTNFGDTFTNCSGLTGSIPENLFSNNTAVTSFHNTFAGCTGLTGSIPENLFSNNTAVTSFSGTFYNCSGLTNIPESLFKYNTAVTDFSYTFTGCTGLTSIPANLFSNNTAVTNFSYTFRYCTGLTSIPTNLFSSNTKVTNFSYTFYGCSGLIGNVPTDTDGTPIYNRSTPGKSGYAIVTSYTYCFYNCTGLTDYDSIPSSWGGGGA